MRVLKISSKRNKKGKDIEKVKLIKNTKKMLKINPNISVITTNMARLKSLSKIL